MVELRNTTGSLVPVSVTETDAERSGRRAFPRVLEVTKDIFTTLSDELHDEAMRKVSNAPTSTHGLIEFINEWVPAFFREGQNVA